MATIKSAGVDSTIPYHVRFNYIHHPPFHSNLPHPVYSTETALKTLTTTIIHPVSSTPNNNQSLAQKFVFTIGSAEEFAIKSIIASH